MVTLSPQWTLHRCRGPHGEVGAQGGLCSGWWTAMLAPQASQKTWSSVAHRRAFRSSYRRSRRRREQHERDNVRAAERWRRGTMRGPPHAAAWWRGSCRITWRSWLLRGTILRSWGSSTSGRTPWASSRRGEGSRRARRWRMQQAEGGSCRGTRPTRRWGE